VNLTYGSYKYPDWAEIIGFCLSISSMMWVPLYALYFALTGPGTVFEVHENIPKYVFLPHDLIFTEHQGGVSAADQTEKNCDL
jgi:hypothetical protein